MGLRNSGRASLRASRVLVPARTEPRPPKDTFPDSRDHARLFSADRTLSEKAPLTRSAIADPTAVQIDSPRSLAISYASLSPRPERQTTTIFPAQAGWLP